MTILDTSQKLTSSWSGGTTTELCIFPQHEVYSGRHFDWRVSCARTAVESSVFTPLPGYTRTILSTDGTLFLSHDGACEVELAPLDVHEFDGGASTCARGVVNDFNIMCRTGVCRAHTFVLRLTANKSAVLAPDSLVYAVHGEIDSCGNTLTAKTDAVCIVINIEYTLKLAHPAEHHKEQWHTALTEFTTSGEDINPFGMHMETADFDTYLAKTRASENQIGMVFDEARGFYLVPATTYFLVGQNEDKILGAISIRHMLTDALRHQGGHIGYGVVPSERRRTFSTRMLALCLAECRVMGMCSVLLTCDRTNAGSRKTMTNNGGVMIGEAIGSDGTLFDKFMITL